MKRDPAPVPSYADYESAKAQWLAEHPDATPAEYAAAMRKIAERTGV